MIFTALQNHQRPRSLSLPSRLALSSWRYLGYFDRFSEFLFDRLMSHLVRSGTQMCENSKSSMRIQAFLDGSMPIYSRAWGSRAAQRITLFVVRDELMTTTTRAISDMAIMGTSRSSTCPESSRRANTSNCPVATRHTSYLSWFSCANSCDRLSNEDLRFSNGTKF